MIRIANKIFRIKTTKAFYYIAAFFVMLNWISLLNPVAFYDYALTPSLIALFASQLIVFIVYPVFKRKFMKLTVFDLFVAAVSSMIMLYGLYSVLFSTAFS